MPIAKPTRAVRKEEHLKFALEGAASSGKTYTALKLMSLIEPDPRKRLLVDTERGRASRYANTFDFDTIQLDDFNPNNFIEALKVAHESGYAVCVIDSLSDEWDGSKALADQINGTNKNKMPGWAAASPAHKKVINAIGHAKLHVICTLRLEYKLQDVMRDGRMVKESVLVPEQRKGEYIRFFLDQCARVEQDHSLTIIKSEIEEIPNGSKVREVNEAFCGVLLNWAKNGKNKKDAPKDNVTSLKPKPAVATNAA